MLSTCDFFCSCLRNTLKCKAFNGITKKMYNNETIKQRMRIGILTLPLHTNYGGILQAYALQTVLEKMGHEVMVICYQRNWQIPIWKRPLCYTKRAILKYILGKKCHIFMESYERKAASVIRQHTDKFINKYVHILSIGDFHEIKPRQFDAFVVGSDQIWRPDYFSGGIENAYLAFAEDWNISRIAYAASFGVDTWEYTKEQTKDCRRLIRKFDTVTVREKSGISLCRHHLGIEAQWVLDPTMLLSKEDYERIVNMAETNTPKGNLLCYVLDDTAEINVLTERLSKEKSLMPYRVNARTEDWYAPLEQRIQPPVEQWLRGFRDAEFVITDSFHACVFSIIFRKQFLVVGNESRGMSRFHSLLSLFDLENRMVCNPERLDFRQIKTIDYDAVAAKMQDLKEISMEILDSIRKV